MKQVYSMYFSGTDTTKKVTEFLAGRLAEDLNRKKIVYDFTLPDARKGYPEFTEDDIVIFGTLMRMKAVFIIRRNWKKCIMKGGQNRNFFFDEKSETRICRSRNKEMNKVNYQKKLDQIIEQEADRRPRLLLHSCCAPCSSYVLEYLSRYFRITVFYYNPNIDSAKEYEKRVEEQKRLIREMKLGEISVIDGRYNPQVFYQAVRGFEKEPEGGKRCYLCYQLRLRETAKLASAEKFDYFTTTLTISPLKNAQWLNEIGEKAGQEYGVAFLPSDFKKKGGYQRSIQLSKEYFLYRQNFCGCVFSKSESRERQKKNTQERQTEKQIEKNK